MGLERAGFETVAFCEIDPFCRAVLAKHWPDVPIFEDVKTLRGEDVGPVDVICGGYPCQPFSLAGERKGAEDDRHLWPEFMRLVAELRPTWVIGENVAGHISMGLDAVLSDLETEGYAARSFVIPACAIGAPHQRDRVWTIGHANGNGQPNGAIDEKASELFEVVANAYNERRQGKSKKPNGSQQQIEPLRSFERERDGWDLPASRVCGGNDGIPKRLDRLRALGNAVVPQIPEILGAIIKEVTND